MNESLSIELHNRAQAWAAIKAQVFPFLANCLQADRRLVLSLKPQKRSLDQNALLHARLTEIAAKHEWAGRKWDAEVWKRLLTAAWLRARGEGVTVLPALDGQGVDVVFRRTSDLSRAECAELIDFIDAWEANL